MYDPAGFDRTKLEALMELKNHRHGRVEEYASNSKLEYLPGRRPWAIPVDIALPNATQNEVSEADARMLVANGVRCVAEGANMPCTPEAVAVFQQAGVLYAPGKASNAGGVATSGLEMTQNAQRLPWTREEVDARLRTVMLEIHANCVKHGESDQRVDYVKGANIAGFSKVADAMLAQGVL